MEGMQGTEANSLSAYSLNPCPFHWDIWQYYISWPFFMAVAMLLNLDEGKQAEVKCSMCSLHYDPCPLLVHQRDAGTRVTYKIPVDGGASIGLGP